MTTTLGYYGRVFIASVQELYRTGPRVSSSNLWLVPGKNFDVKVSGHFGRRSLSHGSLWVGERENVRQWKRVRWWENGTERVREWKRDNQRERERKRCRKSERRK